MLHGIENLGRLFTQECFETHADYLVSLSYSASLPEPLFIDRERSCSTVVLKDSQFYSRVSSMTQNKVSYFTNLYSRVYILTFWPPQNRTELLFLSSFIYLSMIRTNHYTLFPGCLFSPSASGVNSTAKIRCSTLFSDRNPSTKRFAKIYIGHAEQLLVFYIYKFSGAKNVCRY